MAEQVSFIQEQGIFAMFMNAGFVIKIVLIVLIVMSIWSWAITIAKIMQFRRARKDSDEFREIFWEARNFSRIDDATERLAASPLAYLFKSGYKELTHLLHRADESGTSLASLGESSLEGIGQALHRAQFEQTVELEKGITFLATVASSAPFMGLFGTVWGIMNAFHGLSTATSTTIQAVAPGVSEALVTTAIGIAAAIPAAMAYNYFVVAVKHFRQSMAEFETEFLNIAKKYFVK